MQPLNEDELQKLLRQWQAPAAPWNLEQKIWASAKPSGLQGWLQWLMTGSVRIPVPVGVAVVIALLFFVFRPAREQKPPQTGLSQFQAVKEFKPRIIRSSLYENN